MSHVRKRRLLVWAAAIVLVGAGGFAGRTYLLGWTGPKPPSSNSIMILAPYYYQGSWVFDDPSVGLQREPFVAGAPEIIDELTKVIPDAKDGFRLLFSANEFPGYQNQLTWLHGGKSGNYYQLDAPPMEGWLCPALFKYYTDPPSKIFVKAEPLKR